MAHTDLNIAYLLGGRAIRRMNVYGLDQGGVGDVIQVSISAITRHERKGRVDESSCLSGTRSYKGAERGEDSTRVVRRVGRPWGAGWGKCVGFGCQLLI